MSPTPLSRTHVCHCSGRPPACLSPLILRVSQARGPPPRGSRQDPRRPPLSRPGRRRGTHLCQRPDLRSEAGTSSLVSKRTSNLASAPQPQGTGLATAREGSGRAERGGFQTPDPDASAGPPERLPGWRSCHKLRRPRAAAAPGQPRRPELGRRGWTGQGCCAGRRGTLPLPSALCPASPGRTESQHLSPCASSGLFHDRVLSFQGLCRGPEGVCRAGVCARVHTPGEDERPLPVPSPPPSLSALPPLGGPPLRGSVREKGLARPRPAAGRERRVSAAARPGARGGPWGGACYREVWVAAGKRAQAPA